VNKDLSATLLCAVRTQRPLPLLPPLRIFAVFGRVIRPRLVLGPLLILPLLLFLFGVGVATVRIRSVSFLVLFLLLVLLALLLFFLAQVLVVFCLALHGNFVVVFFLLLHRVNRQPRGKFYFRGDQIHQCLPKVVWILFDFDWPLDGDLHRNGLGGAPLFVQFLRFGVGLLALFGYFVVAHVVHSDRPVQNLDPIEVVHGQDGRPLIFVTQKTETFRLSRVLLPNQVQIHHLTISRKNY
jgi:hypothetical protein